MLTTTPTAPQSTAGEVVGHIETFLYEALAQMPPEPVSSGRGRPRVLPSLCLWAGLLTCVLRGFSSQLAIWRLLTSANLWFYPRLAISDQAVYARLEAAGTLPLQHLFSHISQLLALRLTPYLQTNLAPFATQVYALDETSLDQIARSLPALREAASGSDPLLPGKLSALFNLRSQQWQRLEYSPNPHQNEKVMARTMVEGLAKGSLILADLGYFGFKWFDDLTDSQQWWVSRLRAKTSYTLLHTFYAQGQTLDALVWLGAYRADLAAHAVRLVQFRQGPTLYRYLTNVTDPTDLSMLEIAQVYARRWDIELAFKTLKQHLGLHLLWSAKPVVIQQQVWAVLIIAQILQGLQLEIAGRAGVDIFEVSLALMVLYLPQFAYGGLDPVAVFVEQGRATRLIRASKRTQIEAPHIVPAQILAQPAGLVLKRTPRYAKFKPSD